MTYTNPRIRWRVTALAAAAGLTVPAIACWASEPVQASEVTEPTSAGSNPSESAMISAVRSEIVAESPSVTTAPTPSFVLPPPVGPLDLQWWTIDSGGLMYLTGEGGLSLGGTVGQPDVGAVSDGDTLTVDGGFWAGVEAPQTCLANCDGSEEPPVLGPADFTCFLNAYRAAAGLSYAAAVASYPNCDGSTDMPVLGASDFACFLNRYRAGCGK